MDIEKLQLFGIVKDNLVKEMPPLNKSIKTFYITYQISKAILKINGFEFTSKYIGLIQTSLENSNIYSILFFDEQVALPFGNLGREISIILEGCTDGACVLYDTYDQ
jgi:hypothetical protein